MERRKNPRKYKITKYIGMWGDYYLAKIYRVPIILAFVYFAWAGCFMTAMSAFLVFVMFYAIITNRETTLLDSVGFLATYSLLLLASLTGDFILYRVIRAYVKLPKGHLLNPLPPEPNAILPESQVLVRASAPADAATLLRAASGNLTNDAPAVLLRAVNSETTE